MSTTYYCTAQPPQTSGICFVAFLVFPGSCLSLLGMLLKIGVHGMLRKPSRAKAAVNYRNFISKIKGEGVRPDFVPEHVWERWMELWGSDDCVKKSEINAKNRRGCHETTPGTHTVGSISMGEYRKRHAVEKGRDLTPRELHLHVHTHGHDGKSFVDERSCIVHLVFLENCPRVLHMLVILE
ncbi:hypothetical protein KY289_005482 [Solanum tuberosum]|nr:hypothetical protein KY289_005482 [Solanum tuberosum]